jgi:hypothetical protein
MVGIGIVRQHQNPGSWRETGIYTGGDGGGPQQTGGGTAGYESSSHWYYSFAD